MNRGREETHNSLFDSQFTFRLTIHFSTQNSLFVSQFTLDRATNTSQHTLQQMATTKHIQTKVVHYQARNGAQSEAMTARGGQSFSLSADPIPPPAGQSGWAPGYENSIFMPKLRFTKAEGFVQ